jgi:hypothetical protein
MLLVRQRCLEACETCCAERICSTFGCLQLIVDASKLQNDLQAQKSELDKVTAANIELEMQRVQAQVRA